MNPCYITEAYTEDDLHHLTNTSKKCIDELIAAGFFKSELSNHSTEKNHKPLTKELNQPPVPGARLGMDELGNPAWFIEDKEKEGEYVQIDLQSKL